jgi:poly(3-hydroxybutyrate) depolymerase
VIKSAGVAKDKKKESGTRATKKKPKPKKLVSKKNRKKQSSNGSGGKAGLSTQTLGGASCSVFVPSGCSKSKPVPLVVACHGAGASPSQMMNVWQPLAKKHGFIIIAPSGTKANAEKIREEAKKLYNICIKQCYVGGFSQGGIDSGTRAIGGDKEKKWAAIFMLSAPFKIPGSACFKSAAWKIPVYFTCGKSDSMFFSHVKQQHSCAKQYGHPTKLCTPAGGHRVSIHDYEDCWAWLSGYSSP